MKMHSLQDCLLEELRDMYSMESQLLKALPRMARAATNPDLRAGFEEHLEQTRGQKERLDRIFDGLGQKPKAKTCEGMKGILEEGEAQLKTDAEDATMDAMLIGAAQKVEHYEIAAYGTARAWAEYLGLTAAARLLQETLDEERRADQKLTALAESTINAMSAAGDEDEDEEDGDLDTAEGLRRAAPVLSSTGEDDEEGDAEREEIETAMSEDEQDSAYETALGRENRRRADPPRTASRGGDGARVLRNPPATRRRGGNRERSKS